MLHRVKFSFIGVGTQIRVHIVNVQVRKFCALVACSYMNKKRLEKNAASLERTRK